MLVQLNLQHVYFRRIAAFASDKAFCMLYSDLHYAACAKVSLRRLQGLAGM